MNTLQKRIARIASPPHDELAAKRAAKVFGRLNIPPSFDLVRWVARTEQRGDIRARFASIVAGGR